MFSSRFPPAPEPPGHPPPPAPEEHGEHPAKPPRPAATPPAAPARTVTPEACPARRGPAPPAHPIPATGPPGKQPPGAPCRPPLAGSARRPTRGVTHVTACALGVATSHVSLFRQPLPAQKLSGPGELSTVSTGLPGGLASPCRHGTGSRRTSHALPFHILPPTAPQRRSAHGAMAPLPGPARRPGQRDGVQAEGKTGPPGRAQGV